MSESEVMRAAISAGLRAWISSAPDINLSPGLIRDATDFIMAQPGMFADRSRLDFLDECNARLNAKYGTSYGWHLILNHNVNRLMLGHLEVDLCDNDGRNHRAPSCRVAIDAKMREIAEARQRDQQASQGGEQ